MSDESKNPPALQMPNTGHSYEERKAVTEDVLDLGRHELKKEFDNRVAVAKETSTKEYDKLGIFMAKYNDAVVAAAEPELERIKQVLQQMCDLINSLQSLEEGDTPTHFTPETILEDTLVLFGLESMKDNGYMYQGAGLLKKMTKNLKDPKLGSGYPLTAPISLSIEGGIEGSDNTHSFLRVRRAMQVPATTELISARETLVREGLGYFNAVKVLDAAVKDQQALPSKLDDMKMAATAARVADAGGGDVLKALSDSVQKIKEGGTIEALPDFSTEEEDETY